MARLNPSSPLLPGRSGPDEKSLGAVGRVAGQAVGHLRDVLGPTSFGSGDGRGKAVKNSVRVRVMEGERSDQREVYTMTFPATSRSAAVLARSSDR